MPRRTHAVLLVALGLAACADPGRAPTAPTAEPLAAARAVPAADRVTAASRWNALTREIIGRRIANANLAGRVFALVSVAQYDAVIAAEDAKARGVHPSEAGASASAAAAVLLALFPMEQAVIDAQLAADAAYFATLPSERDADWASGVAVGRSVAVAVLARAATDGSAAPWNGTLRLPPGPSVWSYPAGTQPATPLWGEVRPWFMTSGDQFRSAPPPEYGSPTFLQSLDQVRQYSLLSPTDPERIRQLAIAQFWQTGWGPGAVAGYFGAIARELIARQHLDERRAARVLAVLSMAVMDASIACYDSKYYYLYPRPWQADATIATPVGRPNFPSYPSGHSCGTSAAVGVLLGFFPQEADELLPLVEEAGLARIYAGLHYDFDITAGREIGYAVAALALRLAPDDHQPIPLD